MRRTLLDMVQSILNDMDSEPVNSISDSVEAQQIASIVQDTFYNMVSVRKIPEHSELFALTALSDSAKPTFFRMPDRLRRVDYFSYDISTDNSYQYRDLHYLDPLDFLHLLPSTADTTRTLVEIQDGVKVYIRNDRQPTYFTSFDDYYVVCDSYDSSVEDTLQASKARAYGVKYPTFSITDGFEVDLDDTLLSYLLAEAKSTCISLFKGGPDPKVEQAARRLRSYVQNDLHNIDKRPQRPRYGRR
jgi:hypothetical protein